MRGQHFLSNPTPYNTTHLAKSLNWHITLRNNPAYDLSGGIRLSRNDIESILERKKKRAVLNRPNAGML